MLKIYVSTAGGRTYEQEVGEDSVVIGRSSKVDMSIPDRSLSREHARLYHEGGVWHVVDLGSRNGTMVNGRTIDGAQKIVLGDVLALGGTTLTLLDPRSEDAATAAASSFDSGGSIFKPSAELLGESIDAPVESSHADARDLRKYVERLHILNEVHTALARSMALDELLELILDRVFDHLRPEEGAIYLRQGDDFVCATHRSIRGRDNNGKGKPPLYSRNLIEQVAIKGMAALVLDAAVDERFNEAVSLLDAGIKSLVAAPLPGTDGSVGLIVLGSMLRSRQFTEEDMELLNSLASVAAMRISNVRLIAEAMERQKLEQEVALARRIQVALLPDSFPELAGYELYGRNRPSRGVSGDFYKIVERDDGRECVILLADVSGKGIAASLLTASLEALAIVPIESGMEPDEICDVVSKLLYQRTPPEKYATAFLAVLEPVTGRLCYVNAGHNPGLLLHADGGYEWLRSGGRPLGLLPGGSYDPATVTMAPGDTFLVYTDGLTEAENPAGEEYSEERLLEAALMCRDRSPSEMADALEKELEAFVDDVPYADDRTLVVLRKS